MQTLEKDIGGTVRSEVDSVTATVENCVHDGISAALDNLDFSGVELAVRSPNASSGCDPGSLVFYLFYLTRGIFWKCEGKPTFDHFK